MIPLLLVPASVSQMPSTEKLIHKEHVCNDNCLRMTENNIEQIIMLIKIKHLEIEIDSL